MKAVDDNVGPVDSPRPVAPLKPTGLTPLKPKGLTPLGPPGGAALGPPGGAFNSRKDPMLEGLEDILNEPPPKEKKKKKKKKKKKVKFEGMGDSITDFGDLPGGDSDVGEDLPGFDNDGNMDSDVGEILDL